MICLKGEAHGRGGCERIGDLVMKGEPRVGCLDLVKARCCLGEGLRGLEATGWLIDLVKVIHGG